MSIANLLKNNFFEGGPFFMTLHYFMWILVIYFTLKFILNFKKTQASLLKLEKINATILFIGGFGFLLSFFYRTTGMYSAFSVLENSSDISLGLLAGGLKASVIAPLYATFLFLVTGIIWFVFRNKIISKKQMPK